MEIGPHLPPHLACNISRGEREGAKRDSENNCNDTGKTAVDDEFEEEAFGPALPPGFSKPKRTTMIGPCRPETEVTDEFRSDREITNVNDCSSGSEEDDENLAIGPRLPTKDDEDEYLDRRRKEIESRARIKKDELVDEKGPKKTEREEWMTELPPELGKNFGLGPRTFRTRDVDLGDRSVWTDTPSDRAKKENKSELKNPKPHEKSKKERDMEQYVNEHNKRFRSESLLEIHQQDQEKKKKHESSSQKERRPFDRETDLGVRQMDAPKRKSLIKESLHLNTKFEHSKQGPTYL